MFTGRGVLMILAAISLTSICIASPAMARGGHVARARAYHSHPRMREAMGRNRNMNRRMDRDYGHLGGNFNKLQGERHNIARQEKQDFQKQGYLTRGQKQQFNKEDNQVNRQIASDYHGRGNWNKGPNNSRRDWDRQRWDKDHPRQSQVLGRDNGLNRELSRDKGKLGGNYNTLKSEQQSIKKEDITDRKANGGYITKAQKQQMDQQEKQLQQQIKQDYKKPQ